MMPELSMITRTTPATLTLETWLTNLQPTTVQVQLDLKVSAPLGDCFVDGWYSSTFSQVVTLSGGVAAQPLTTHWTIEGDLPCLCNLEIETTSL